MRHESHARYLLRLSWPVGSTMVNRTPMYNYAPEGFGRWLGHRAFEYQGDSSHGALSMLWGMATVYVLAYSCHLMSVTNDIPPLSSSSTVLAKPEWSPRNDGWGSRWFLLRFGADMEIASIFFSIHFSPRHPFPSYRARLIWWERIKIPIVEPTGNAPWKPCEISPSVELTGRPVGRNQNNAILLTHA